MNPKFALTCALALAVGVLLASVPAAHAKTICAGTVKGPAVLTGGITVPSGETCTLRSGVTVSGGVAILANATLFVDGTHTNHTVIFGDVTVATGASLLSSGGTITGNVTGTQCNYIALGAIDDAIIVGGNLEIEGCFVPDAGEGYSGYPNPGDHYSVTIRGNVLCENNGSSCYLVGGTVAGYVIVSGNGTSQSQVGANVIDRYLQCQSNTGVINGGDPNTVVGGEQGQCTGL